MRELLLKIKENYNSKLLDEVVDIVLDEAEANDESVKEYLEEVLEHGCQSGFVTHLIYYKDTRAFFMRHFDEIFEIINDNDIEVQELNANELAWIGFEYMAQELYSICI